MLRSQHLRGWLQQWHSHTHTRRCTEFSVPTLPLQMFSTLSPPPSGSSLSDSCPCSLKHLGGGEDVPANMMSSPHKKKKKTNLFKQLPGIFSCVSAPSGHAHNNKLRLVLFFYVSECSTAIVHYLKPSLGFRQRSDQSEEKILLFFECASASVTPGCFRVRRELFWLYLLLEGILLCSLITVFKNLPLTNSSTP